MCDGTGGSLVFPKPHLCRPRSRAVTLQGALGLFAFSLYGRVYLGALLPKPVIRALVGLIGFGMTAVFTVRLFG